MYLYGSNKRENVRMQRTKGGKKEIYAQGIRGEKYKVDVIDKNTGTINDIYLMKYTKEGPIFQKQIYSRWKEEQAKAKAKQLTIIKLL